IYVRPTNDELNYCGDFRELGQPDKKCRCDGKPCTVGRCKFARGDNDDKCISA
uniref:Ornatin-B n=1 Tax=Placobdella ornata TaxID=6415 RepID=ORNB_PLAOR|nr:RecName: Full=Ornatin-B [Placobdella ornata]AAB20872.1 ornatin B [Placobdella ornata=turtle leech, Peptide, 52 aa] [Placobdella ornata]